jgi:hypothetical protein
MYTNEVVEQVRKDIQHWILNFVEAPNPHYGEKFPVCPYARQARLAGESSVKVYQAGSVRKFIEQCADELAQDNQHKVLMIAFPPRVKYYPGIHRYIYNLDKQLVARDLYALGGQAVGTESCYPGWFNRGEYFVVGINTLSNVLPAVESLKSAGYYQNWSQEHYHAVVERRQKLYEKHGNHSK